MINFNLDKKIDQINANIKVVMDKFKCKKIKLDVNIVN